MKKRWVFLLGGVLIILLVILFIRAPGRGQSVIQEYDMLMDVTVAGDGLGFDTSSDGLHFSQLNPGGQSIRRLNFTNMHDFPVEITFTRDDSEMARWLSFDQVHFVMPGENRRIQISLNVPEDAVLGEYNGSIHTVIRRHRS